MAYKGGRPIAFGADALEHAGADNVFVAKWFKLQYVHWTCVAQTSLTTPLVCAVCTLSLQVTISTLLSRSHLSNLTAYGSTIGVAPTIEIPPLPPMVSLKKIYADLLGYLFNHGTPALTTPILILTLAKAREFFKNHTVDGARIWTRLGHQVTICLATPNGWDISQQVRLSL